MSSGDHNRYPVFERAPVLVTETTRWKPNNAESEPNCPRCDSSNTKFCYYNNYSLSQPRYFCKGCRRHWTKGGSLRNVRVGGGCRKSRRARATRKDEGRSCASMQSSHDEAESGADTDDLAAVFAKYVSRDVDDNNEEHCSPGAGLASSDNLQASSFGTGSRTDRDGTRFELPKQVDLVNGADDQLQRFYEFIDASFEVDRVIGEQIAATDTFVSSEGSNLPGLGCQQAMAELQGLDIFSGDDQLRLSGNIASDNWDPLTCVSGYELSYMGFI